MVSGVIDEQDTGFDIFYPFRYTLYFLSQYGWYLLGAVIATCYAAHKVVPVYKRWKEAREDAEYHKDPDKALARMEAIQRARERQQQQLLEASQRAKEQKLEQERRKREEVLENLKKYGAATAGGHMLGSENDYLPLSGGASTSTYRPPKKSKCGGGGCGR